MGKTKNAGFGSGVVGLAGRSEQSTEGGNVDDTTVALAHHETSDGAASKKDTS